MHSLEKVWMVMKNSNILMLFLLRAFTIKKSTLVRMSKILAGRWNHVLWVCKICLLFNRWFCFLQFQDEFFRTVLGLWSSYKHYLSGCCIAVWSSQFMVQAGAAGWLVLFTKPSCNHLLAAAPFCPVNISLQSQIQANRPPRSGRTGYI